MLTVELKTTYQTCNHGFKYSETNNPRRVLTKPSKPAKNDGHDNEDYDYILYVNDILGSAEGHKYVILDVLGSGTFGQVVKCRNIKTDEVVAIKVVKNKLAYFKQSMMEVAILEMLNQRYDIHDQHHLLRLRDTFIHRKHLCLVFELLSVNLYELIKQNHFRGLSTNLVRVFTAQILDALTVLNEARIIHCDLKPENILLKNLESPTIKVIDFGSACHEVQTIYTYIQSRFYRSPEVLVGLPYTSAIDMWSLGCIAAELFLGLPLFPGNSEYNQLSRIVEMLGSPPNYMIEVGKNAHRYFEREIMPDGKKRYVLKSIDKYSKEQGKSEQPSKRYFSAKTLPELINNYPIMRKSQMSQREIDKERWSPQQAKQHPFITGEKFDCPFRPPYIPRKQQVHVSTLQSNDVVPQSVNYQQQHNVPQPTFSDTYLSSAYSTLPTHFEQQQQQQTVNHHGHSHSKRMSFIPPLPSVLEPPHNLFNQYQHQYPELPSNLSNFDLSNNCMSSHSNHLNAPQTSNGITISGGRPRANTVGTMQVPPQIQWAAVDNANGAQLYSPYYPYGHQPPSQQHQQQQGSFTNFGGFRLEGNQEVLPRWVGAGMSSIGNRQTIDLERDGDWQEEISRKPHHTHRRSNSSTIRFSDIQTSLSSSSINSSHARSSVSSLHRLMRGHSYNRPEDLEWDGVAHHSPPQIQQHQHHNNIQEGDLNQNLGRKWNKDQPGWTMA
ncbi:kinase-like protein [Rhizopus microsporus var. microsporus]|uniref:Kinase-like protein n=1 Tax=Rhizopus microsporus var. microsporus TaxID=86635 RepID=A0A1X0QUU0_RHIZD|nr:kinase-like protein [Rhizopus microsporus var. microsporus]